MRRKKRGAMREGGMPAPQLGSLYVNRSIKAPKGSASGGVTSDSTKKRQATPQFKRGFRSATVAAELPRSIAQKRRRVCFMVAAAESSVRKFVMVARSRHG